MDAKCSRQELYKTCSKRTERSAKRCCCVAAIETGRLGSLQADLLVKQRFDEEGSALFV
jgi:hypothetical protein